SRDPCTQSHTDNCAIACVVKAPYAPLPSELPAAAAARRGFLLPASDRSPSSPWMATPLEVDPGRAGGSIGVKLNVLNVFGVVVLIIGHGYAISRKQLLGLKSLYPLIMDVF